MAYLTRAQLDALCGPENVRRAITDEQGADEEASFAALAQLASDDVDAILGARFDVPFTSPPASVSRAARVFAADLIFRRRGMTGDANPYAAEAQRERDRLDRIASGEIPLSIDATDPTAASPLVNEADPVADFGPEAEDGL